MTSETEVFAADCGTSSEHQNFIEQSAVASHAWSPVINVVSEGAQEVVIFQHSCRFW